MSYLVLARKWRPQGFEDLIGQEPVVRVLSNSIRQGKTAHAYIFSGPRGVGKTSTARILAKALNCAEGPTPSPCGSCASCSSITSGYSIDVIEIDGASNNSVDDVRDLREKVKYSPSAGKFKVYIIDESHMLSGSAFNALLKTLEEPPPHVVFILATTEPRKIPLTVMSRCQHLPFRRVSAQPIKERLRLVSDAEGIKIPDGALGMIARAADGSIRDALTILDQAASFSSEVSEPDIQGLLGVADFGVVAGVAGAVIDGDRKLILRSVSDLIDSGTDLRAFAKDLLRFFRDLLVMNVIGEGGDALEPPLDVSGEELALLREAAGKVGEEHLTLILSEMIKGESDVRTAFSPRVALEMTLLRLSYLNMLRPVGEAIRALEALERHGLSPNKPETKGAASAELSTRPEEPEKTPERPENTPPEKTPEPPEKAQGPEAAAAEKRKPALRRPHTGDSLLRSIVERIEDPRLSSKLLAAAASLEGDTLTLTFQSSEAEICAEPVKENSAAISGIASALRGAETKIAIDVRQTSTVGRKELKDKALSEPLIRKALDLFDGRIVDVKMTEEGQ